MAAGKTANSRRKEHVEWGAAVTGVGTRGEHRVQGGTRTLGVRLAEGTDVRILTKSQAWDGVPGRKEPAGRGRAQGGSRSSATGWKHGDGLESAKEQGLQRTGGVQKRVEGALGSSKRVKEPTEAPGLKGPAASVFVQGPCGVLVPAPMGSHSAVLGHPEPQAPRDPPSLAAARGEEPQAQSAHGTGTARRLRHCRAPPPQPLRLLAPLQDTVRRMLKREPPERSGRPGAAAGSEAPGTARPQRGPPSPLGPSCGTLSSRRREPLPPQQGGTPEASPESPTFPSPPATPSSSHAARFFSPLGSRKFSTQESPAA